MESRKTQERETPKKERAEGGSRGGGRLCATGGWLKASGGHRPASGLVAPPGTEPAAAAALPSPQLAARRGGATCRCPLSRWHLHEDAQSEAFIGRQQEQLQGVQEQLQGVQALPPPLPRPCQLIPAPGTLGSHRAGAAAAAAPTRVPV